MRNQTVILLASVIILSFGSCHRNSTAKIEALYTEADSAYRAGNHTRSISIATEVAEKARANRMPYLAGKAEDLLAVIVSESYGGEDVARHRWRAAEEYLKADSIRDHRYALIDLAVAYTNSDNIRKAMVLLDSIRMAAASDSAIVTACLRTSYPIAIFTGNLMDASQIKMQLDNYRNCYTPDALDYACLAVNYNSDVWIDSASAVAKTPVDHEFIDFAKRQRLYRSGNFGKFSTESDSAREADDSDSQRLRSTPVITSQRDYFGQKAEHERNRASNLMFIIIGLAVILFCLVMGGSAFYRMKLRTKNAEIESMMEALSKLSSRLTAEQAEKAEARARIESLFRERWDTINLLCSEFFEKGDSEKARASIVNEVEKELDRLRTPQKLNQIEQSVDQCRGGLISALRRQCPFLKNDDIIFLTLIYAGFSPRAVCLFTGIKLKYFYTKRSRLIARIEASSAPDRALFIEKLG